MSLSSFPEAFPNGQGHSSVLSLVPEISIIVPLFNEQENIETLYGRLSTVLGKLGYPYELIFVNDGSRDATPCLLDALYQRDPHVVVLHLSRNFGHQPAITAGIERARGRGVMIMDGDLQDPPEVIPQFVARWQEGFDVVYAVRRKRKENILKRLSYLGFYRILRHIGDLDIPLDAGDFCLMDRKVVDALCQLPEQGRFVRGLRTYVGFRQVGLEYERAGREAGKPKYTLTALIKLAIDGLVSFSSYPLRLATTIGLVTTGVAVILLVWILRDALIHHTAPRGWASLFAGVLFMGSMQLICLGIIGEYIRLIFLETKKRPPFIVAEHRTRPLNEIESLNPQAQGDFGH